MTAKWTRRERLLYRRLGLEIRCRREALGISQAALGIRARLGRASISNIEAGLQKPLIDTLVLICSALDCLPGELLDHLK